LVVAENYPQLKPSKISCPPETPRELESEIADREALQRPVAAFNARISQLPDVFIAKA